MNRLEAEFKALTLSAGQTSIPLAARQAPGTLGRRINLLANTYALKIKPVTVTHYDVDIKAVGTRRPEGGAARPLGRALCNRVWDKFVKDKQTPVLSSTAFDGAKSAFAVDKLFPEDSQTFDVELEPETPTRSPPVFKLTLTVAEKIDLSILDEYTKASNAGSVSANAAAAAIMGLDVLFRHDVARKKGVIQGAGGRKVFEERSGSTNLGWGAVMLKGFFRSIRPTASGMVVNLDTAYSPYLTSGKLLTVCSTIVGRPQAGSGGAAARGGRGGVRGRGGGGGWGGRGGVAMPSSGRPVEEFSRAELHELKRKLKGANVRVLHRADQRSFRIVGFGAPSDEHKISITKKGTKSSKPKPSAVERAQRAATGLSPPSTSSPAPQQSLTVAEYFKQTYPAQQINPRLQCVELQGNTFVPIEALELLAGNFHPNTALNAQQATKMINVAAKPPNDRLAEINATRAAQGYEMNDKLKAWGIQVSSEMCKVQGRVLSPPRVNYQSPPPRVNSGSWNLVNCRFLVPNPKPLEQWGVIVVDSPLQSTSRNVVDAFFDTLMNQARARGMNIKSSAPQCIIYAREEPTDTLRALREANGAITSSPSNPTRAPPQLLFIILHNPRIYDTIKKQSTLELAAPLPSQVCLAKNIVNGPRLDQFCGNLLLKIHAKLGGVNSQVAPTDLPGWTSKTMMLGADVTHPTGASTLGVRPEDLPSSIAASVATLPGKGGLHSVQIREQGGRVEFIAELQAMVKAQLEAWISSANGVRPEKLIMWRDGVSEGQFGPVVESEVTAIKAACRSIDANYSPKLTFIVCAKRHHIRFFAAESKDKTGNLPAGTVVDTSVTHPYLYDFFLQAHAGLKGTAKPTRYIVLLDENNFTSDSIEKLANSLCYNFARATRAVSLVPVAYYADIICTKARSFVYDDDASTSVGVSGRPRRPTDWIQTQLDRTVEGFGATMPAQWFM
ncbi:Piwi domain-domain-containing protein [Leucosporidium creatinivorum]|uniref:Piwi domain-domain-containing protein n=1 Tax=Leucosporidium creatinivorum TaxID=106004 RepID=A0A1Y2FZU1_9BASI|nr:Piwi domain-domain-containing protein [Leucosporidium creatinivorum]